MEKNIITAATLSFGDINDFVDSFPASTYRGIKMI